MCRSVSVTNSLAELKQYMCRSVSVTRAAEMNSLEELKEYMRQTLERLYPEVRGEWPTREEIHAQFETDPKGAKARVEARMLYDWACIPDFEARQLLSDLGREFDDLRGEGS